MKSMCGIAIAEHQPKSCILNGQMRRINKGREPSNNPRAVHQQTQNNIAVTLADDRITDGAYSQKSPRDPSSDTRDTRSSHTAWHKLTRLSERADFNKDVPQIIGS